MAFVVIVGVAVTMPFIKKFTQSNYDLSYLCLVYGLFALNTVASYLLSYNQTLLAADQHEYITTLITSVSSTLMYIVQFVVLYSVKFFADKAREFFVIYLLVAVLFTFIGNIVVYIIVRRKYPYIKKFKKKSLEKMINQRSKKSWRADLS